MSVMPPVSYLTATIWTANTLKPRKSLQTSRQDRELQFKCPNVNHNMKNYMWPKGGMHKMGSMLVTLRLALEEPIIKHVMYGLEWPRTHALSNDH